MLYYVLFRSVHQGQLSSCFSTNDNDIVTFVGLGIGDCHMCHNKDMQFNVIQYIYTHAHLCVHLSVLYIFGELLTYGNMSTLFLRTFPKKHFLIRLCENRLSSGVAKWQYVLHFLFIIFFLLKCILFIYFY